MTTDATVTLPLTDRVALVTGASGGIGAAIASRIARSGAATVLLGRRADELGAVAQAIRRAGGTAMTCPGDITEDGVAEAAIDQAVRQFGHLDIFVNNAGLMLVGEATEAPLAEWNQMLDLNLRAALRSIHAALPYLVSAAKSGENGVADLVSVSSIVSGRATETLAVYSATKAAIEMFSDTIRRELVATGVRVAVVSPGSVETDLRAQNRPEIRDRLNASTLRRISAGDVAETVDFILTRPSNVSIGSLVVAPRTQPT